MKSFWALVLVIVFLTACGGGGNGQANNSDPNPNPNPLGERYPCKKVSDLSRCEAEFKGVEVRAWYNMLTFYMEDPIEYELAGTEDANAFECGARMDEVARLSFDSVVYEQAKDHMFDIYELFVSQEDCTHKPNLDALFREVLQEQ